MWTRINWTLNVQSVISEPIAKDMSKNILIRFMEKQNNLKSPKLCVKIVEENLNSHVILEIML